MRLGVQLYGPSSHEKDTLLNLCRKLKKIGYRMIEPIVNLDDSGIYSPFIPDSTEILKEYESIKALGMEMVSCHVVGNLLQNISKIRRLAEECGIRQFVVKCPTEAVEEKIQNAAIEYMTAADTIADTGAELVIHNRKQDGYTVMNGVSVYEYLLGQCHGKVGLQVDLHWLMEAEIDPVRFLEQYKPYIRSLHFGKFNEENDNSLKLYQFARANEIPVIIDQDTFTDVYRELEDTAKYFNSLGQSRGCSKSILNILDVDSGKISPIHIFDGIIEAPDWVPGENRIVFNSEGRILIFDLDTCNTELIATGICDQCNNDHVLSADGKEIAVSHGGYRDGSYVSKIYRIPLSGGEAECICDFTPSFLHGWSFEKKEIAYCGFREINGQVEVDVYSLEIGSNCENRLTEGGFNDGPEYSPDGQYIIYNSTASGSMQIWRMNKDGSDKLQLTNSDRNNWFGHVSPDQKSIIYLSYEKGNIDPDEHLPEMNVQLYMIDFDGQNPRHLASFFGGQGSINVNSWASDSKRVAFVSYM